MKARCLIALLVLLAASLACNLPLQFQGASPEPVFSTVVQSTVSALLTETAGAQSVLVPTATLAATATNTATFTPVPTLTFTPTPSYTFTPTLRQHTPTAPPTITPLPTRPTLTRTPTRPVQPGRTMADAFYTNTPPVMDGVWDEWQGSEYPAGAVVYGAANWSGPDDLGASFRAAWDNQYLYLAVKVHDDVYAQNASGNSLYLGDSLEVLLDTDLGGDFSSRALSGDDFQLGIAAGRPEVGSAPEAYLWFPRAIAGGRAGVRIAAMRQAGITRVEAAIPWSVFGIAPRAGQQFGFALSVSDDDDTGQNVQQSMVSNAPGRVLVDPTTWTMLNLK